MKRINFKEMHYGWVIVGAVFLIMAAAWGIVYNCSSLFIDPISDELGFSRSQINATMTIRAACQMGVSLFAGKIFKRFDIKGVMKVASIVLVVSFFTFSFAVSLWSFYLITFISSISITLIAIIPLSIIISNWFDEKKGTALGIAFMGSGVGGMVFSSLTGIWIEAYGWRVAYQILALSMGVIIIPSIFFIIKLYPREKGLQPVGVSKESAESFAAKENFGVTLAEAMKSVKFWALNLSSILLFIMINGLMMNVAPHLRNIGYSITYSANVVALIMATLAVGKVALGKLFDSIGIKWTTMIACLSSLLAIVGLIFAEYTWALLVVIIFAGLGSAYATIANSVLTVELFGKKDYNAILGFLSAIAAIGSVVGPIITGVLYDASGNYYSSYQVLIVFGLIATLLYWIIFTKKDSDIEQPIA